MQVLLPLIIFSRNKNMKELILFVPDFSFPLNRGGYKVKYPKLFGEVFYKDPPPKKCLTWLGKNQTNIPQMVVG